MRSVRMVLAAIAAMTALTVSRSASAQTGSDEAGRNALIDQAVEAQRAMNHVRALELAMRANSIRSTGTLRGFIAREQIALGRLGDALGNAELCARDAPSEPASRSRDNILAWCRAQMTELRQRVGRVVLQLESQPGGLQVSVAGTPINNALIGTPYVVTPGTVLIEATAPGHAPFRREIMVAANMSVNVAIALAPTPNDHPREHVADIRRGQLSAQPAFDTARSPLGGVVMAVGAVGVVAGAISWFAADGMYRTLAMRCPCPDAEVDRDGAPIQTLDTVANIGLFGGAGLIAVGAVLFFALTHEQRRSAIAHLLVGPGTLGLTASF